MIIESGSQSNSKEATRYSQGPRANSLDPSKLNQKVTSSDLRNIIKSPDHFIFMFAIESKLI